MVFDQSKVDRVCARIHRYLCPIAVAGLAAYFIVSYISVQKRNEELRQAEASAAHSTQAGESWGDNMGQGWGNSGSGVIPKDHVWQMGNVKRYAPTLRPKKGIFACDNDNSVDPVFSVTENGKPVIGVYVPANYFYTFDGGWFVSRDDSDLMEFDRAKAIGIGAKRTLDIKIHRDINPSEEYPGMFPLVIPHNCLPSDEILDRADEHGVKICIDGNGRFFSSRPVSGLFVDYYEGGLQRTDQVEVEKYRACPSSIQLNTSRMGIRAQVIDGVAVYVPTYVMGSEDLKDQVACIGFIPYKGPKTKIDNLILENLGKSPEEQRQATSKHYWYPSHWFDASDIYLDMLNKYESTNGQEGLSLLELLNYMIVADCDVANLEFMLRLRLQGHNTRLGAGYRTDYLGRGMERQLHGWCEVLGQEDTWTVSDATPFTNFYTFEPLSKVSTFEILAD